jgi:ribonuclease HI
MEIYVDGSKVPVPEDGTLHNGIGIHIRDNPNMNISICVVVDSADTGTIELIAICVALILSENVPSVKIYSDCQHAVDPLTSRYSEFISNGWMTKQKKRIADYEFFRECSEIMESRRSKGHKIKIKKVEGHSGNEGNCMADRLAYAAASSNLTSTIVLDIRTTITVAVTHCDGLIKVKEQIDLINIAPEVSEEILTRQDSGHSFEIVTKSDIELNKWTRPLTGTTSTINKSDKVVEYHLFPLCIKHGGMIWIRCPSNHPINSEQGFGSLSECSILPTICRTCITSHLDDTQTIDVSKLVTGLISAMDALGVSPSIIKTSRFGRCAAKISGNEQKVLQKDGGTSLISITDILMKCDSRCRVVSIDVEQECPLPYLEFGFL